MKFIKQLLLVAGPTACGKSTFIGTIASPAMSPLASRLGLPDLNTWPRMVARRFHLADHLEMDRLIVHYDFVWAPGGSILQSDWEKRALSIIGAAREVTLVTLWTPPERLERQLIDGKLRAALPYNALQVIKAGFFRLLPEFVVQRLSRAKMVDLFNRVFPGRLLTHHLLLLRVYSKGGSTADLYRKWLRFCDENVPHARAHCIVEFDSELKLHSREEWESVVASLTEDPAA